LDEVVKVHQKAGDELGGGDVEEKGSFHLKMAVIWGVFRPAAVEPGFLRCVVNSTRLIAISGVGLPSGK